MCWKWPFDHCIFFFLKSLCVFEKRCRYISLKLPLFSEFSLQTSVNLPQQWIKHSLMCKVGDSQLLLLYLWAFFSHLHFLWSPTMSVTCLQGLIVPSGLDVLAFVLPSAMIPHGLHCPTASVEIADMVGITSKIRRRERWGKSFSAEMLMNLPHSLETRLVSRAGEGGRQRLF